METTIHTDINFLKVLAILSILLLFIMILAFFQTHDFSTTQIEILQLTSDSTSWTGSWNESWIGSWKGW